MRKVLAFGCFDILHMGHYTYLKNARKLGDKLIVVVARDSTIRKFKKREPVLDEESRRKLVESLKFVDSAILGSTGDKYQIIKKIKPDDWVFSTHRSHYHALLKGIPKLWLRNEILYNRSIHIYNKEYKFFTSAIVGGILPIALGTALAIKRKGSKEQVWCFVGDMAASGGIFSECTKYAGGWELPIHFIIEDNGFSTDTPTNKVWGPGEFGPYLKVYEYKRGYPHVGVGKWVTF